MNHGAIGRLVGLLTVVAFVVSCVGVSAPVPVTGTAWAGRQPPPAGFRAYSLSFTSAGDGWALGHAPCGSGSCTYVVRTRDGGRTWSNVGRVPAEMTQDSSKNCLGEASDCVGHIVFASSQVGYAFEPSLLVTHDGGRSWRWIRGAQVHDLVMAGGIPLRVAGVEPTADCVEGCHLQRSLDAGDTWSDVPAAPIVQETGVSVRAGDASHLYMAGYANAAGGRWDKRATLYQSEDGGRSWRSFADPCGGGFAQSLVALPSDAAVVLCDSPSGGSDRGLVVVSRDGARTFTSPRAVPGGGFPGLLAAASPDIFAATANGVETTVDGGLHWHTSLQNCWVGTPGSFYPDGMMWSLGYVTPGIAHALCPTDRIWTTRDGGEHWSSRRFDD